MIITATNSSLSTPVCTSPRKVKNKISYFTIAKMKLQVALIAVVVVYLATIATSTNSQEAHPDTAFLPLGDFAPAEHHQADSFLEPNEGLVRNKRQFGYGGYGGGYRGGYGGGYRGGYGGYGGRGFGGGYGGRGGYGGFRGGYGGYGR